MWKVTLLIAAASLAAMEHAASQDTTPQGPWCGREDIGGGTVVERCHFTTYQECREIMLGGTGTSCTQNPRYVAPPPAAAPRKDNRPRS